MTKVILNKGKEISFLRFHPWVFSGAIKTIEGTVAEGDIVEVYTFDKKFVGSGHYQAGSISIRMLSFEQEIIDAGFWKKKIKKAFDYRHFLGLTKNPETNVYRLIFGEGDGLPGLIIDYYNRHIVIQCHGIGMHKSIDEIAAALNEV